MTGDHKEPVVPEWVRRAKARELPVVDRTGAVKAPAKPERRFIPTAEYERMVTK